MKLSWNEETPSPLMSRTSGEFLLSGVVMLNPLNMWLSSPFSMIPESLGAPVPVRPLSQRLKGI